MLERQARATPDQVYLRQPTNGVYEELSWADVYDQTLRLAQGLLKQGLQPGDRVALISANCAQWFICDFAMLAAGLVPTPIYATAGEGTISYVLEHSEAKAIIIGKLGQPDVVQKAVPESVVTIGMSACGIPTDLKLKDLIADNEPLANVAKPDMSDLFSIVYTSGSTGKPKGVVLTYGNISYAGASSAEILRGDYKLRLLSYLPLAHVTERGLVEYGGLYGGAVITFNESLETFITDLRNARVTGFISVPRLWVKFQSQVLAAIPQRKLSLMLSIPILSSIIKRKIKKQLGLAECRMFGSGSAPISPAILQWYRKLGIDISEGWGMTESSGMATTQYPYRADKVGTIGKAMEGYEVKISEVGEILIRGEGIFREYYKSPEITAESFAKDSYFRTGDKGEIDNEGFLRITGRVKDIFKTGKGKYVAPVPIEGLFASNLLIEQLCVMGSGLPAPMVVAVLSEEVADTATREEISESLLETMQSVNKQVEKHEALGGIFISKEPWTIENGLLTPTLKVKRAELEENFLDKVAKPHSETVVWE